MLSRARSSSSSLLRSGSIRASFICQPYGTKAGATEPLLNVTVGQLLSDHKAKYEHKDLLVVPHQDIKWTHVELDRYVRAWGNGLPEARVRRKPSPATSDRVLSLLPNDAENIVTQLGSAMAGRVVVPASPDASAAEVDLALKSLDARMVVFPAKYNGRNNIEFFYNLDEEIRTWPKHVALNLKKYPVLKQVVNTGDEYHSGNTMWRDLLLFDPTPSLLPPPGSISPNEAAVGYITAGKPGASYYTHGDLVNSSVFFGGAVGLNSAARVCLALPLHTSQGLQTMLAAVAHGAVVVIPSSVFNPEEVLASIERDVCTTVHLSPEQLAAVLASPLLPKHNLSTLEKVVLVGPAAGSASSEELTQLVERAMSALKVKEVEVGLTAPNVAGVLFTGSASQNPTNPAAGRLLPHVEAKIVDGSGKPVKVGSSGSLFVKGLGVSQQAADKQGWLDTGLTTSLSADGLYIAH